MTGPNRRASAWARISASLAQAGGRTGAQEALVEAVSHYERSHSACSALPDMVRTGEHDRTVRLIDALAAQRGDRGERYTLVRALGEAGRIAMADEQARTGKTSRVLRYETLG